MRILMSSPNVPSQRAHTILPPKTKLKCAAAPHGKQPTNSNSMKKLSEEYVYAINGYF